MNTKNVFCIHDKKSDTYDGFMLTNNYAEAIRGFEMACQKNEIFQQWPEDFELIHCVTIKYSNGEESGFDKEESDYIAVAQAKDYVKKETKKETKIENTAK